MATQERNIAIFNSPWAILPEKLNELFSAYGTHMREKHDLSSDGKQKKRPESYDVVNGTAIISLVNIITKNLTFWSFLFGGTSSVEVGEQVKSALSDPDIEGILLYIDSPGGTVDGTQELANLIYSSRGRKPIVAFSDGMMASAAYYIGSAADKIYISGDMVSVGSIGVVATHVDYSEWEKKLGIKSTEIYAGKYKRITSQYQPLSEEGRENIQDRVDYMYSIFVDDVAKQRGVSPEAVLKNMADGKIFIGKQAIKAGLVDGVSTQDRLLMTKEGLAVNAIQAWKSNSKLQKEYNYNFGKYLATIDLDSTPLHRGKGD